MNIAKFPDVIKTEEKEDDEDNKEMTEETIKKIVRLSHETLEAKANWNKEVRNYEIIKECNGNAVFAYKKV